MASGYEEAVKRGFQEFAAGHYAQARTRFLEAQTIMPNARVLRALGMVEYELREYAQAVSYLDQALQSEVRPLDDAERVEANELREQAGAYLARYTLYITPGSARLLLDSAPLQLAADHAALLGVGDHVLEAHAPGYAALWRELHVVSRGEARLDLSLIPLPPTAAATTTLPRKATGVVSAEAHDSPIYARPWLWIGVGAVIAGTAVALAIALRPRNPLQQDAPIMTTHTEPGVSIQLLQGR